MSQSSRKGRSFVDGFSSYMFQLLPRQAAIAIVLAAGLYFLLFFPLYAWIGFGASVLVLLPTMVIAWLHGARAGVLFGFLAIPLNMLSLSLTYGPPDEKFWTAGMPGHAVTIVIAFVLGRFRDLSRQLQRELAERSAVEQALTENQALLAGVLNSSLDAIMVFRPVQGENDRIINLKTTLVNPTAEKLLQQSADKLVGRNLQQSMPFSGTAVLFEQLVQVIESGRPLQTEMAMETQQGTRWVQFQAARLRDGATVTFGDITQRKQTEIALRESEEKYRLISENMQDLLLLYDRNGRITYVSPSVQTMLGYAPKTLLGKNPYAYFHPEDIAITRSAAYQQALRERKPWIFEHRIRRHDGTYIWVEARLNAIVDENGRTQYFQTVSRDITEHKQYQAQLHAAKEKAEKATRTKSEFLANMSHEIRTPMNAIIGLTSLLLDTPLTAEQRDYVKTMRISGDGLLSIINDILDFSKIEAGKLELEAASFNLHECVYEAVELISQSAHQKNVQLIPIVAPQVPEQFVGDVTRLRQVLVNLLNNAIKFTEQGEIILSVTSKPQAAERVQLEFAVIDTGIGIPEKRLERLFQSFSQVDSSTTRRFGGTGLGLAISKRLVEAMGGDIWVESKEGEGSTFAFTVVGTALAPADTAARSKRRLAGKRILVVDEMPLQLFLIKYYLTAWGVRSYLVTNGRTALQKLQSKRTFDAVCINQNLQGEEAFTLVEEIRRLPQGDALPLLLIGERHPHLPAALAEDAHIEYCLSPIKPHTFRASITRALSANEEKAPAQTAVANEAAPSFDASLGARHPLHILLAEDNRINQKVALRILARLGYRADVAANGLEVLEAVQRQPYDVILMDIQMPEMDGVAATEQIRSQLSADSQPYIIALTANAMQGDREIYLATGMDDYLPKPIRVESLVEALGRVPFFVQPAHEQ